MTGTTGPSDAETVEPRVSGLMAALEPFSLPPESVRAIVRLALTGGQGATPPPAAPQSPELVARLFLKRSLSRSDELGPGLVSDTAWNMMLALFAESGSSRPISVTSACFASGAPHTTALRYLSQLERMGHVRRHEDPFDLRRSNLSLTPDSRDMMARLIESFRIPPASNG